MRRFLKISALLLVLVNLILASWYIIHGDIIFNADIARDFLLLDEILLKKFILIGPRASGLPGLFHGPLWLYLNFPAYLLGNGNPVIVGWFWVFLTILFLISGFFIAKKLFSEPAAYIYIILLSAYMIDHTKGLFNPDGALFLLPIFYYLFIRYKETLRVKYLLLHLFVAGLIIQFQMAVGIPLFILSSAYILFIIYKNKKFTHILSFSILAIPFSTFIVFDLRHDFQQINSIVRVYSTPKGFDIAALAETIEQRSSHLMTGGLQLFSGSLDKLNIIIPLMLGFILLLKIKAIKTIYKSRYFIFSYFYLGFYILSVIHSGSLLYHYWFPLASLTLLIFSSFVMFLQKRVYIPILALAICFNLFNGIQKVQDASEKIIGKKFDSWSFQYNMAQTIFKDGENTFGYFAYAPDIYAYGPKYSLSYVRSLYPTKNVSSFEKKKITYLTLEPPPSYRPELTGDYWKKNQVRIKTKPVKTVNFPNGYQIEKYILSDQEVQEPIDPTLDTGVHFR